MCLEIGNKVAVLDDVITGVITSVVGENISIIASDGMKYTYFSSELVKIGVDQNELINKVAVSKSFLKNKLKTEQKKTSFKKVKNEVIMEVDLHAEKLVKSTRGMDNFDILNLQIRVAQSKIEYCVQKKISKIIFIHGVGEGVLKSELHYLLNKYPVKYYEASYQQYGLGATEVFVFQNM